MLYNIFKGILFLIFLSYSALTMSSSLAFSSSSYTFTMLYDNRDLNFYINLIKKRNLASALNKLYEEDAKAKDCGGNNGAPFHNDITSITHKYNYKLYTAM